MGLLVAIYIGSMPMYINLRGRLYSTGKQATIITTASAGWLFLFFYIEEKMNWLLMQN